MWEAVWKSSHAGQTRLMLKQMLTLMLMLPCGCGGELIAVDDTMGLGRTFDGIGGLSGGSGTSKLLADYLEPQRSQVLDYLFKPQFGASLQILKVEIGGDAQASDATEASHMHNASDENYHRGYEWWLMKEAKRRNPAIKLYGLPWDFPAWVGNGTRDPYNDPRRLATYIVKWVKGAKVVHSLDIDYIGIWNERPYDITYIKTLRTMLDAEGLKKTRIVAADGGWDVISDVTRDAELSAALEAVGVHYPGTESPADAVSLGTPLWASEDYSSVNDEIGAGCWARILNQNYVNGMMTSTIAWNLVDSYLRGLPWDRDSLMTARQPWSGHYTVDTPVWVTAHTCQFTSPGWLYLRHGYGVGRLEKGGSIVTLTTLDASHLTFVIETMSHDDSQCIRPPLPAYNVTTQNITLQLMGSFVDIQELQVWYTKLDPAGHGNIIFSKLTPLKVTSGQVQVTLGVNEIYTLTTMTTGQKGDHGPPPAPAPFPVDYFAFFDELNVSSEAPYISAQQGVFEVVAVNSYDKRLRQTVLETPIPWCASTASLNATLAVLGDVQWSEIEVRAEAVMVAVNGSGGVYVAARVNGTGCDTYRATGLFFFLFPNDQLFLLTKDLAGSEVIVGGRNDKAIDKVDNTMKLLVYRGHVSGAVNRVPLFNVSIPEDVPGEGFVGLGTDSYGYAEWEFLGLRNASNPLIIASADDQGLVVEEDDGESPLLFHSEPH
ncbi:galactocerebrosidase-like [Babylonia areolata]|uniref:galactocerebrosidase-like n=1 Tax=Babylonia areolata TaxID=304850 RepID=UPI003FD216CB